MAYISTNNDPCATCLRRYECNGEDREFCPVVQAEAKS